MYCDYIEGSRRVEYEPTDCELRPGKPWVTVEYFTVQPMGTQIYLAMWSSTKEEAEGWFFWRSGVYRVDGKPQVIPIRRAWGPEILALAKATVERYGNQSQIEWAPTGYEQFITGAL